MRRSRAALLFVCLLAGAPASAVTIGFDDLAAMGNTPGTPVPLANQLSTQLLASFGVRFASDSDFVAVVSHAPNPTPSLPNVIGGVNQAGALSYGSAVFVSFFDPSNPSQKAVTDSVSIRGDGLALLNATATMDAFDPDGTPLGTITANDTPGGLTLALAFPNIHLVRITQSSASGPTDGTIALDDLSFGALTAVPEPASGLLLGLGLSLLAARRRR